MLILPLPCLENGLCCVQSSPFKEMVIIPVSANCPEKGVTRALVSRGSCRKGGGLTGCQTQVLAPSFPPSLPSLAFLIHEAFLKLQLCLTRSTAHVGPCLPPEDSESDAGDKQCPNARHDVLPQPWCIYVCGGDEGVLEEELSSARGHVLSLL